MGLTGSFLCNCDPASERTGERREDLSCRTYSKGLVLASWSYALGQSVVVVGTCGGGCLPHGGQEAEQSSNGKGLGRDPVPTPTAHDPPSLTSATTFNSLFGKFRNVPYFFIEARSQHHNERTHAG